MKAFLLALFFGGSVILTEVPFEVLPGENHVTLPRTISAVTSGAALYIDVTKMVPAELLEENEAVHEWIARRIPRRCLSAELGSDDGVAAHLEFNGGFASTPERIELMLTGIEDSLPLFRAFSRLTVTSCARMEAVGLRWQNYSM